MSWLSWASVRTAWRFVISTFTRDTCDRCHQLKLNVMFRWKYERKLCDQCWVALKYAEQGVRPRWMR